MKNDDDDDDDDDLEEKEDLPGAAADVFAFSIILWEMYTREYPYAELKNSRFTVMRKVMSGYRLDTSTFTPVSKCLIEACWNHNLHERPSFDVVLSSLRHCKEEIISSQTNWFSKKKKKRESLCTDFGSVVAAPSALRKHPPAPPSDVVTLLKKKDEKNVLSDLEISCRENKKKMRRHTSNEQQIDKLTPRRNRILRKCESRRRRRLGSLPEEIMREEFLRKTEKNREKKKTGGRSSIGKSVFKQGFGVVGEKKNDEKSLGERGAEFYKRSVNF